MKICIDISAITSQSAGIARYVRNLVFNLTQAHPEDEFILVSFYGTDEEHLARLRKFPNVTIKMFRNQGRIFRTNIYTRCMFDQPYSDLPEADVYHFPDHVFPAESKRPSVITIHDLSFERFPQDFTWINRTYMKKIVRFSAGRARKIITVSQSAKDDIMSIYKIPTERICVIHNGIEDIFFEAKRAEDAEVLQHMGVSVPYVLNVGTIEPRKNLSRLIQAFIMTKREAELPHKLIVCGARGWKDSSILEKAGDVVQFLGHVGDEELRVLYRNADLFVYPSLYEGFGLPILEALASGAPVLTSKTSSMPEIAGEAAILVDPYSVESIVDGIKLGLQDSALRGKLSTSGREHAKSFSWKKCAQETYVVYEKATSDSSS